MYKSNKECKQCFCIGAENCKDTNCPLVQKYIESKNIKPRVQKICYYCEFFNEEDRMCYIGEDIMSIEYCNDYGPIDRRK